AEQLTSDIERQSQDVKAGMQIGGRGPTTSTQWIAEALIIENGWDIYPDTLTHGYLLRMIGRGQREIADRLLQNVRGEPTIVTDQTFAPEHYILDTDRQRIRQNSAPVSI